MQLRILMNVRRDSMLMLNGCRGEGRRWMEDFVSQVDPEGMLDAGQRKTQCGGSVSAFSARADHGPPGLYLE